MTAIMMAAAGLSVPFTGGVALDTTITSLGQIVYDSIGGSEPETAYYYCYKAASTYHEIVTFGSSAGTIGSNTYSDGGSTTRTINSIGYSDGGILGTPPGETDNIYFVLDGGADTDTTFVSIEYGGQTYTRASRSAYTALTSGVSWRWDNVNPNGPTFGTPAVVVNI